MTDYRQVDVEFEDFPNADTLITEARIKAVREFGEADETQVQEIERLAP